MPLGNPSATVVFSQLPACSDESMLHGNALYISYLLHSTKNARIATNILHVSAGLLLPNRENAVIQKLFLCSKI